MYRPRGCGSTILFVTNAPASPMRAPNRRARVGVGMVMAHKPLQSGSRPMWVANPPTFDFFIHYTLPV